jgi:NAD(P)H-nitrite reductase large subunit
MRYVIIGNSTAGIAAVEGIRQIDKTGSIIIVSEEAHHSYSRPLISYLLLGKTDEKKMRYRDEDFYERNGCETYFSKKALRIDPSLKRLFLEGGTFLEYDKLLAATGSSPFVPPVEGLDLVANKHTFMTLDDACRLSDSLYPEAEVLIMGAGLIGLKCAEGIRKRVKSITVIDPAPRILSSVLDENGSIIVKDHLERQGISFRLSCSVSKFKGDTAVLSDGTEKSFDMLVLAAGVRPNVSLVKESGGKVDRGIITDKFMETSIPDIFAAGDCTESIDCTTGESKVLALLPNAYLQGECAGINMAGGRKAFEKAIAMNAMCFMGLSIITAGAYTGRGHEFTNGESYKKLFTADDQLKGYIMIKDISKAGIYTSIIRDKIPLSGLDFDLIAKQPGLLAFSREQRTIKLGGVPV